MASLISSIFGGDTPTVGPDIFESKNFSVPSVLHKFASAKNTTPNNSNGKDDVIKALPSSEVIPKGVGSIDDKPSSPTLEDAPSSTSPENATTKKTKEELKEEEERTIFVGNLPPDISRRSLAGIFKLCGIVASTRLRSIAVAGVKLPPEQAGNQNLMRKVCANTGKMLTDTPKKSAQGYVVFEAVESVEKALKLNNTTYQSHTIRVDHANPTVEPSRSVFVGNLPYSADEETLRDHFLESLTDGEDLNESEGCAISGIRIVRDKETHKCKGFGYVTVRDATLVPLALQLHGSTYLKRDLRVMVCGKRFKSKRGDGGGTTTGTSSTTNQSSKRKLEGATSPIISRGGGVKRRRARSEKKGAPHSAINKMSKRAATEAKVNKRVKKLEYRAAKGMKKKKT